MTSIYMGKQSEATPFGDFPRIARLASPRKKATSTTTPSGAARGRKQSGTHARATPATAFFSLASVEEDLPERSRPHEVVDARTQRLRVRRIFVSQGDRTFR